MNATKTSAQGYLGKYDVEVWCIGLKCSYLCPCKVEGRGSFCGTNSHLHFVSSRSEMDIPVGGLLASDVAPDNFSSPAP